jgi:hypothetical protein
MGFDANRVAVLKANDLSNLNKRRIEHDYDQRQLLQGACA